jgi:hypothetical protein
VESERRAWGDRLTDWLPVAVVVAIGLWAFNSFPVGVLHDDAVYVILAKSLATRQGYRYLNLPGAPAATHFPPGYPALLSLLWVVSPSLSVSILLFKIVNVAFLAVTAAQCRRLLRDQLEFGSRASASLAFLAAASVPVLILSALVMSETLFLAVVLCGLVAAERSLRAPQSMALLTAAAAIAALSLLVRTHGIALVGALFIALLTYRRWRDAAIAAALAIVALVPWQLWTAAHQGNVPVVLQGAYGSYGGWIGRALGENGVSFVARTIASNVDRTAATLSAAIAPVDAVLPRAAALVVLVLLVGAGARTMWAKARVALLFTVFYMAIVFAWPVEPARYIWGVWPLLFILPTVGARAIWEWRPRTSAVRYARTALVAASVAAGIGYGAGMAQGYAGRYWDDIPRAGAVMLRPLVVGIRAHARDGEVIATPAEAAMYVYTGHQTVPVYTYAPTQLFHDLTLAEKTNALREILTIYPVSALVTSSEAERIVARSVGASGGVTLAPRDSFDGGTILSVVKR